MKQTILIFAILLGCLSLAAVIEQSLENADNLTVGSPFQFIIKAPVSLKNVEIPDTLTVFEVSKTSIVKEPGKPDYLKLTIIPWVHGPLSFPRLKVIPARIFASELYTDAFRVHVMQVRAEADTLLRDIKPLRKYPAQIPYRYYKYALIFSGIMLLMALLLYLLSKKKKPGNPISVKTDIGIDQKTPFWQETIAKMEALRNSINPVIPDPDRESSSTSVIPDPSQPDKSGQTDRLKPVLQSHHESSSVIPDPDRESSSTSVIPDPSQPDKSGQTDRLKPVLHSHHESSSVIPDSDRESSSTPVIPDSDRESINNSNPSEASINFKQFCFRFSDIIRDYLETGYGFNAMEMTAFEIDNYLKRFLIHPEARPWNMDLELMDKGGQTPPATEPSQSLPGISLATIPDLLYFCDRVKFAKQDTAIPELDARSLSFIRMVKDIHQQEAVSSVSSIKQ